MNPIVTATKKPIEVFAIQYKNVGDTEKILSLIEKESNEKAYYHKDTQSIYIRKKRGNVQLKTGDYVIYENNTDKEFWAIKKDIFYKTYTKIEGKQNAYRKNRYEIEALHLTDISKNESLIKVYQFLGLPENKAKELLFDQGVANKIREKQCVIINTLEGKERLYLGEYLVRGIVGEYYPVSDKWFEKVYEIKSVKN